jgi:hypothetical protein
VGVALGTVLAMVLAGVVLVAPIHSAAGAQLAVTPANGSVQQWAFGGNASISYSCNSPASCFGAGNTTGFSSASFSYNYVITWAVIYTQTNVSSTQTTEEIQAGIGATASLSFSECFTANSTPCQTFSASATVNGNEYGVGFTNVTSAGTVFLTPVTGTPGNVPADAIMNAASSELYNFSGNFNVNTPAEDSTPAVSESANFDFGGNESSGIAFGTPLGLVPLNPQPGDTWSSNASYSAHGGYTAGFTISYTADSRSYTNASWASGVVTPSGQLFENGTDLGAFTLYDNYTNPVTTVTAQEILVSFSSGDEFSMADGWVLIPDGLFGSLDDLLAHPMSGILPATAAPAQGIGDLTSSETAYFEPGTGFVGAAVATGATTIPIGTGANAPNVNLQAGPEPVSRAQGQYNGIVSGSSSSSSGFPWSWLIIGVVVVVIVGIVAAMVVMRARKRPPTPMNQYNAAAGAPMAPPPPPMGGPGNP